jgi:hypothetical protein
MTKIANPKFKINAAPVECLTWCSGLLGHWFVEVVMEGFNFHSDFRILEQKNARDCSATPSEWIDTTIASKRVGPRPLFGFRNRKFDISSIKQLAIYFRCINEIEMNPSDPKQMEAPGNKELNRDRDDPGGRAVDRLHFLSTGDKTCGFNRIDKSQARAEDRGLRQLYFVFPREGNWRAFLSYELMPTPRRCACVQLGTH